MLQPHHLRPPWPSCRMVLAILGQGVLLLTAGGALLVLRQPSLSAEPTIVSPPAGRLSLPAVAPPRQTHGAGRRQA